MHCHIGKGHCRIGKVRSRLVAICKSVVPFDCRIPTKTYGAIGEIERNSDPRGKGQETARDSGREVCGFIVNHDF